VGLDATKTARLWRKKRRRKERALRASCAARIAAQATPVKALAPA
jgi:hypothetical protein